MFKLHHIQPQIADNQYALPLVLQGNGRDMIRFENVVFGYDPNRPILNGVTIDIPLGKKIAFVGHSGCGKSTVLKLLYRFYDPSEGKITINGRDLRDYNLDSVRKHIGVVPQDTILFNQTLHYNIAYGKTDATQEEVEDAAKFARLDEVIQRFPSKHETRVGERGVMISGGEKQRVQLARMYLKVFILYCPRHKLTDRIRKSFYLMRRLLHWMHILKQPSWQQSMPFWSQSWDGMARLVCLSHTD